MDIRTRAAALAPLDLQVGAHDFVGPRHGCIAGLLQGLSEGMAFAQKAGEALQALGAS